VSKIELVVPNISCHHCVRNITREVKALPGVRDVAADVSSKQVIVTYDAPASEQGIREMLAEIGYPPEGA
jgi:copper chaperone